MAKSLWIAGLGASLAINATRYTAFSNGSFDGNATETNRYNTLRAAGTFSNLYVRVSSNAAATNTTVRFRINVANGNQNLTIGAGATGEFEDTSNTDAVVAADEVAIQYVTGTTGAIFPTVTTAVFNATSNTAVVIGSTGGTIASTDSVTQFFSLGKNVANGDPTEANAQSNIGTAGTLNNMFMLVSANGRTTTTTYGTRINGASGTLAISVGSGATGLFEDTTHSDSVAAGDLVGFYFTTSTGGGTLTCQNLMVNLVTTNNKFVQAGVGNSSLAVTAGSTVYTNFTGGNIASATETDYRADANIDCSVTNLWAYVSANATSSPSTLRFRVDGGNGNEVVTIGAGATGEFEDTTNRDTLAPANELALQIVNGGGGTLTLRSITALFTSGGWGRLIAGERNMLMVAA